MDLIPGKWYMADILAAAAELFMGFSSSRFIGRLIAGK